MINFIKMVVKDFKGENNRIKHSPDYYKRTGDIIKNLQMYQEALKKIKTKYGLKSLTGEEFDKKAEEIWLANYYTLFRAGILCNPELDKKAIEFEKKYGKRDETVNLKRKIRMARKEKKVSNISNKKAIKRVLMDLMIDIRFNVRPYEETEYRQDWVRKVKLLEVNLKKRGIDSIEEYKHDEEIREAWAKVKEQIENEARKTWDKNIQVSRKLEKGRPREAVIGRGARC